jgi:hypothetical protein
MEKNMNYIVITSINSVTEAIRKFSKINGWHVLVVGDLKSKQYEYANTTFLDIEKQKETDFLSFQTTPFNHYSRKNIGYLYAIKNKANLIYDTDDDTIPYENWSTNDFTCDNYIKGKVFVNPFCFFTEEKCWPRGTPLSFINQENKYEKNLEEVKIGVWQGVINDDSDFDAIYRLTNNKHIKFNNNPKIAIDKFSYSPFNSQSTLWNSLFNCLLYIPTTVDFRFTDILRSYITQRIMWEFDYRIGFHKPNTYQVRNEHDFFKDFLGEVSMYQNLPKVIDMLNNINLKNRTIQECLTQVYNSLYEIQIVKIEELDNLDNWIKDYNSIK